MSPTHLRAAALLLLLPLLLFSGEVTGCNKGKSDAHSASGSQSSQDDKNEVSPSNVMSIGFEGMNDGFSYHEDTVICAVLIILGVAVCTFLTCYFSRKYKLCHREPPQPVGFNKPHWQNVSMADLNNRFEDLGAVGVTPAYPPPPPTQVVPTGAKTRFEARLAALESASRMASLKTAVEEG